MIVFFKETLNLIQSNKQLSTNRDLLTKTHAINDYYIIFFVFKQFRLIFFMWVLISAKGIYRLNLLTIFIKFIIVWP